MLWFFALFSAVPALREPARNAAGQGVSVVSLGQWPAFLIGPPLIGGVAGLVGLRDALFVLVGAALLIVVLAGRIQQHGGTASTLTAGRAPEVG